MKGSLRLFRIISKASSDAKNLPGKTRTCTLTALILSQGCVFAAVYASFYLK